MVRKGSTWSASSETPSSTLKGPHRYGPFNEAFRDRFVLVYGSVDLVADSALLDPARKVEFQGRGMIVYGHAESNAAWLALLADSPVQIRRGSVRIGQRELSGDDLAYQILP